MKGELNSYDSAAEKLVKCANDVENFLGARRGALSQSIESLQRHISDLKYDMKTIENMEYVVQEDITSIVNNLENKKQEAVINAKKIINEELTGYFKEGVLIEKKESEAKLQEIKKQREEWEAKHPFDAIFSRNNSDKDWHRENTRHFNPNEDLIKFSDKEKAEDLLKKIQKIIEETASSQQIFLDKSIEKMLNEFISDFDKVAESAKQITLEINSIDVQKNNFTH